MPRYGRWGHHPQCMCEGCMQTYAMHNQRDSAEGYCTCDECIKTRQILMRLEVERTPSTVATVNFCEREQCQTMGKSTAMGTVTFMLSPEMPTERREFCPGCIAEFVAWMKGAPQGDRPRAYQEPYTPNPNPTLDNLTGEQLMKLGLERMNREIEA